MYSTLSEQRHREIYWCSFYFEGIGYGNSECCCRKFDVKVFVITCQKQEISVFQVLLTVKLVNVRIVCWNISCFNETCTHLYMLKMSFGKQQQQKKSVWLIFRCSIVQKILYWSSVLKQVIPSVKSLKKYYL